MRPEAGQMGCEPATLTEPASVGASGTKPREVRLCVGEYVPTRTAGRPNRVRRRPAMGGPPGGSEGLLAQLLDSEFWTIERLTALVGIVFLALNFLVLSYWLPHPHVHLPHLHMPHLPRLPRRRPRFPSAPSVKVVPADAAAAADAALESRAWRAVVNRGDGAPEASRGGDGGVRGEDGAPAVMDVDDVAEQSRAKGGGGTVVEAGAGG